MTILDKIYTGLCILFCVLIVLCNLTYQKFVEINIPLFHIFQLSAGAVIYPLTYLITDLITEFYGKEKANFCVRMAILMNIIVVIIIGLMDFLPATKWSKIDDNMFHQIFGFYSIAFIGSMVACYVSQFIDISLYLWIRKLTGAKHLWLRNNASTAISLFIDTFIVVGFLGIFNILPLEHMWVLIGNSYSWKLFFSICSTPLFYGSVWIIRFFSKKR